VSIPTDEQIRQWRERWEKYPDLPDQIAVILRGDGPVPVQDLRARERLLAVENLFNNKMEFEKGKTIVRYGIVYPSLDLCGIPWREVNLEKAVLLGAQLEGAELIKARMSGACLLSTKLTKAVLYEAQLNGAFILEAHLAGANFWNAHLEGADLRGVQLEGACLKETHMEGANFGLAHLEGVNLIFAQLSEADFSFCIMNNETKFGYNTYIPHYADLIFPFRWKSVFNIICKYGYNCDLDKNEIKIVEGLTDYFSGSWRTSNKSKLIWKLLANRWFFTGFRGVKIEDADTTLAADLRRYVEDQRYVRRIKERHPWLYNIWNLTTACGWATWRIGALSLIAIIIFAFLYAWIPGLVKPLDPTETISPFMQWFYLSFDIFTNLGLRISTKPASNWGVVAMFIETILGWSALGLLLSVFSNKIARRS